MPIRIPTAPRGVILAGCAGLQMCLGTVYAWSYLQKMLVDQFGWTYTETAWAFSITIFSLGMSAAWAGMKLPKFGPRKLALAGSVMFSGGYLIGSLALEMDLLMLFYVGFGVIGGAGIGFGYVTPVATAAKWFPDHKGMATGITVMGFGVGAILLSKGLAPVLEQTQDDLTMVFFWLGIIFAGILIPLSLLICDPPPDFDPTKSAGEKAPAAQPESEPIPPVRACLTSPEFAVMWIVFFFNIAAGIFGPVYVGYLKDEYPDRAVTHCFLIGVVMLVFGYIFTFLLRDDRSQVSRPTVESTLREFGIEPRPRVA